MKSILTLTFAAICYGSAIKRNNEFFEYAGIPEDHGNNAVQDGVQPSATLTPANPSLTDTGSNNAPLDDSGLVDFAGFPENEPVQVKPTVLPEIPPIVDNPIILVSETPPERSFSTISLNPSATPNTGSNTDNPPTDDSGLVDFAGINP